MLADLKIEILSLADYPEVPETREDGTSYLENALKKARAVAEATGEMALADDSGLEVEALSGAPGIHSARYAGADASDAGNLQKVLENLKGVPKAKRGAAFRCVLVLYRPDGKYEVFTGSWHGQITDAPVGEGGFGYDPIFFLPDRQMTAAQLSAAEKNRLSHRGQALARFREWLQSEIISGRSAAR